MAAFAATDASGLRAAEHPDGITRVVVDLSHSIDFTAHVSESPNRIVIETDDLHWTTSPHMTRVVGPITDINYTNGTLTLKLNHPALIKQSFLMSPRDGAGWRLVVDVREASKQEFAEHAHPNKTPPAAAVAVADKPKAAPIVITSPNAPAAAPPPPPTVALPAEPVTPVSRSSGHAPSITALLPPPLPAAPPPPAAEISLPAPAALPMVEPPKPAPPEKAKHDNAKAKDPRQVIVLDPGHGGVDPGATGVSGIYEKFFTYSMARELQQQLEKTGHYRVHLTRNRDVFIPLRERIAIARQLNADLFVSLHADVVKDTDIRGLSVYTLSQNASDAEAQSLADKENKADLIAGVDLSHESSDVTNILIDLAQRETMNRSAGFASNIVDEFGREIPLLSNTHRFAGFAVLKSPDVPAVLIEMGYLSNTADEKNLRQPEYRAKLAHAITRAVEDYFLQSQKAKRP